MPVPVGPPPDEFESPVSAAEEVDGTTFGGAPPPLECEGDISVPDGTTGGTAPWAIASGAIGPPGGSGIGLDETGI